MIPKIGMRGRVKQQLNVERYYVDPNGDDLGVAYDMLDYEGQEFVITRLGRSFGRSGGPRPYIFHINLDDEEFFWNTEMVELYPIKLLKPKTNTKGETCAG